MSLSTKLNTTPYYDDHDQQKDFYRILFQPGVSVQVRELNQLQTLFQQQVERFGDNIFSSGTIVNGCNFNFLDTVGYVKIKDVDIAGVITLPYSYVNYNLRNETNGLTAWVMNYQDGFEASDPNLKTLYINYQDTGNPGINAVSFSPGDILTVYDPVLNGVEKVNIAAGGLGFANTDLLLAISPLVVSVSSGSLNEGDYLLNEAGANVEIKSVDANTLASSNQFIVTVAPRGVDLANSQANTMNWTMLNSQPLTNPGASLVAKVDRVIGTGFIGRIVTDATGVVIGTGITNKGVGYIYDPFMTVRSIGNESGYSTLNLQAQNYFAKLTISSGPSAVGNGYIFGVTEGVIYQKGYFLRVQPQQIIVSKYNTLPDNVAVGFITNEEIINYNQDSSLLDNVNNTQNAQAPGGDRLKMTPVLNLISAADAAANTQFLTIVAWKEGRPYKQNQSTIYSRIGDEMAKRTDDASGNFIIDPFLVTTRSPIVANDEGEKFNIVIDPGSAYIDGYRVVTSSNFNINDEKGTDTAIINNHAISLNYGNYLVINNVAGTFGYNLGDSVDLYDSPRNFVGNTTLIVAATLQPSGTKIGTANVRSLKQYNDKPGTPSATFKLYIFNLIMNTGRNIADVKSVYYNGAHKGVGDVVLSKDPTSGANIAVIQDTAFDQLLFPAGVESLKNANDVSYTYRTMNQSVAISNGNITNATLVLDISSSSETFPYLGWLSSGQLSELYVVPTGGELTSALAGTGVGAVATTGSNVVGNTSGTGSNSAFLSDFAAGDFIYMVANGTGGGAQLCQVVSVTNNSFMSLSVNPTQTNNIAKFYRTYPQNVPIPFGFRQGLSANVNINQNILTLDFGRAFSFAGTLSASLGVDIVRNTVSQLNKTPNRNRFVKIQCANNETTNIGPWCLGVPDVFRLRSIFIGNSSVSNTGTNYVDHFYVDHNQNADYYGLSYLYIAGNSPMPVGANDYMIVEFDHFTASGAGFYDTVSYTHSSDANTIFLQDSQPLSNTTTVAQSWEVPELFTDDGTEMDLLKYFDFRPYCANTVATATLVGSAPVNPSSVVTLSTSGEKKFPSPDSQFIADIEHYLGRKDSIFVDKNGGFSVVQGPASFNPAKRVLPSQPQYTMKIVDMVIPPYPNLPSNYSLNLAEVLNTRVMNQKFLTTRIKNQTVHTPVANNVLPYNQPKVYTMADIGNLERRLSDVEYYASLSALEAGVSHTIIYSSVDPSMDRFKFGFFVDDFTISGYSDLTNPQYAALKEEDCIVPSKMTWDVSLFGGPPDHFDIMIIQQGIATVSNGGITGTPLCALNLSNTVAYLQMYRSQSDMPLGANVDSVNLTFASNTTIYDTVNYLDEPITQWLQSHTFDQYKNFNIKLPVQQGAAFPLLSAQVQALIGQNNQWGYKGVDTSGNISDFSTQFSLWEQISQTFTSQGEIGPANPYYWNPGHGAAWSTGFGPLGSNTNPIQGGVTPGTQWAQRGANRLGTGQIAFANLQLTTAYAMLGSDPGQLSAVLPYREILGSVPNLLQSYYSTEITAGKKPSGGQVVDTIYYPPTVLYFYCYDTPTKIEIFQNDVLVMSSDTAIVLAPEDKKLLTSDAAQNWFNDQPDLFMKDLQVGANGFVTFAGKMNFNYNPTNGTTFTVRTTVSGTPGNSPRWRWVMAYPIDGSSVGCVPPTKYFNVPPDFQAKYEVHDLVGMWCGNQSPIFGSISVLHGFTETWNPSTIIPTTSVIPFDITKDWYQ